MTTRFLPCCRGLLQTLAACLLAALAVDSASDPVAGSLWAASPVDAEATSETPPINRLAALYAPSLDVSGTAETQLTPESVSSGNGVRLYGPAVRGVMPAAPAPLRRLPKGESGRGLYAPSCPVSSSTEYAGPQASPGSVRATSLYAPCSSSSCPGAVAPMGDDGECASLTEGNSWGPGIEMSGVRGRRLGMVRHSMYSGDIDTLTLLYDLAPASQAEEVDPMAEPPRELSKVSLPVYRVKPPDTLQIMGLRLVPRPPYHIETYDVLQINVSGTLRGQPIMGYFLVEAEGVVSLGPAYGPVRVVGMTLDEAKTQIAQHLEATLRHPGVTIQLGRSQGAQQLSGIYQIGPDGIINLRDYGVVHVAGKTVGEVRAAVEQQLARFYDAPQVTVEVVGYNSDTYYVITAGAAVGENIQRFGMTGNETVLDAISQMQGLSSISSTTMWIARATPGGMGCTEILPVDWDAVTRGAITDTNYQLLPGDRLYIVDDKLVSTDTMIARFTQPIERVLGITSLGTTTIRTTQTLGRSYNQSRRGF